MERLDALLANDLAANVPDLGDRVYVGHAPNQDPGAPFCVVEPLESESLTVKGEVLGITHRVAVRVWYSSATHSVAGSAAFDAALVATMRFCEANHYGFDGAASPAYDVEAQMTVGDVYASGLTLVA